MKKYKVYLVDITDLDVISNFSFLKNNEEFIKIAEEQGNVYSIESFEELYNSNSGGFQESSYIRIIEVETN